MNTVQQLGVPDGYAAHSSPKHRVLLHRLRPSGSAVCGRVRPPWLPADGPYENAAVCGACAYILSLDGEPCSPTTKGQDANQLAATGAAEGGRP